VLQPRFRGVGPAKGQPQAADRGFELCAVFRFEPRIVRRGRFEPRRPQPVQHGLRRGGRRIGARHGQRELRQQLRIARGQRIDLPSRIVESFPTGDLIALRVAEIGARDREAYARKCARPATARPAVLTRRRYDS
jgi:hypothetical protein